ncbi:antirestriction protein ArdA [Enterococcus hulanensis]|uniref:antirestriction protein ArdA n=1 Tax=Enterococcus hulanensis TaxID=2559929 RepID=UPI00288E4AF1|nr:antirestriction protein ArdA [Enterococcus hulanensis]MDT2661141.1 antirestriction protein ArdA [Enterococcus hulanensis]
MELRVYVANLGKYNEGELVGAWFTPPIDFDEMKEQIGLNDEYEEYAIHDYELPFEIDEYIRIDELNRLCSLAEEIADTPIGDACHEIQRAFFSSFEEMVEHIDDIYHYPDCHDMSDVAYQLVNEGMLGEVSEKLGNYIDCDAYGRDLEISGNYVVTTQGVFEYVG